MTNAASDKLTAFYLIREFAFCGAKDRTKRYWYLGHLARKVNQSPVPDIPTKSIPELGRSRLGSRMRRGGVGDNSRVR